MVKEKKKCPRCGEEYYEYPSISRLDNETEICPNCGMAEAFEDLFNEPYTGVPYWVVKDEG